MVVNEPTMFSFFHGSRLGQGVFSAHFEDQRVEVPLPVIEPELAFLQVQVKGVLVQAPESGHAGLRVAPEALHAVDVRPLLANPFAPPDPVVPTVADVRKAAVAAAGVGEDDAPRHDAPPDYALERGAGAVGHDLRVNPPLPFEQTKDDCLLQHALAFGPLGAPRPEAALVHLHFARDGQVRLAGGGNPLPYAFQEPVDRVAVKARQMGYLHRGQVNAEQLGELPELRLRDF